MTPHHRGLLACIGRVRSDAPAERFGLITASMALSRSILNRVEGFDAEIERGSDSFFSQQLKAAGFRLGFAGVLVEHHFEEKRLLHSSFVNASHKIGCASAYVAWHWDHKKITAPRFQAFFFRVLLELYRAAHLRFLGVNRKKEGCSEREMQLVQKAAFFRQYCVEAGRPRNYALLGLSKRPSPVESVR